MTELGERRDGGHKDLTGIAREKQLKGWVRAKKIALIEKINPGWEDLAPSFPKLGPSTQARQD